MRFISLVVSMKSVLPDPAVIILQKALEIPVSEGNRLTIFILNRSQLQVGVIEHIKYVPHGPSHFPGSGQKRLLLFREGMLPVTQNLLQVEPVKLQLLFGQKPTHHVLRDGHDF